MALGNGRTCQFSKPKSKAPDAPMRICLTPTTECINTCLHIKPNALHNATCALDHPLDAMAMAMAMAVAVAVARR